jgi:hypothetical protein
MSPIAHLLATGHETGALDALDGLGLFVAIGLFVCVGLVALVIGLVITGVRRRKKHTPPPAPGEPPTARR